MNEEIKQQIEEEAIKHQEWLFDGFLEEPTLAESKLQCIEDFKKGANFILSKWQEADRWRKVSEVLPEMGFRVLIKNEFNVIQRGYIDTVGEWRYCLDNRLIKLKPIEWKPIR